MADSPDPKPNSEKRTDPEAGKVKVTLAHPHDGNDPGAVLTLDEVEAKRLRRAGIAEPEDA